MENSIRKQYREETGESPNAAAWEPQDYTSKYVEWLEKKNANLERLLFEMDNPTEFER